MHIHQIMHSSVCLLKLLLPLLLLLLAVYKEPVSTNMVATYMQQYKIKGDNQQLF